MAQLQTDGSPLQLRVEGKYRGVHFGVVGRIQLRFEHGLWNEWHLLFDDMRSGWLGEAQGTYAVSFVKPIGEPVPDFARPSGRSAPQAGWAMVRGAGHPEGVCALAVKGSCLSAWGPGMKPPSRTCRETAVPLPPSTIAKSRRWCFLGEYVEFDALQLSGLREFDGW